MQGQPPAGDATAHDRVGAELAGLLEALGRGEVDEVLDALGSEAWSSGIDPAGLDGERYAFTRGLCAEAVRALDRSDPWVMAAGIALRQALGLWIEGESPPGGSTARR